MERYHYHCRNILLFLFRVLFTILHPIRHYIPNNHTIHAMIFALVSIQVYMTLDFSQYTGPNTIQNVTLIIH